MQTRVTADETHTGQREENQEAIMLLYDEGFGQLTHSYNLTNAKY